MKQESPHSVLLGALLALGLAFSAGAAIVTVSSTETWDGTNNPHLADGVTITGSGTDADPYTYTIPNGLRITSTGRINLHGEGDYSIKFIVQGGDLQMDAGGVLNVERYGIRYTPNKTFVLDLSGTNSITGAGQIGPITFYTSTPRVVTIQNVKNINLAKIDLHTENVDANPIAERPLTIIASGAVVVTGMIDNGDWDARGDGGADITIQANTIDVNNLDTRGRSSGGTVSGNIFLYALSPVGSYNPGDGVNNAATNKLTVRGSIRTDGTGDINGNVTLQAVVLQLVFGVIQTPPSAVKDLHVGVTQGGATASDLFVDVSNSGQTVQRDVQWGGTFTAPPGSPPSFTLDPFTKPDAAQNAAYASSLVGTATDPDVGDTLTFAKFSGPAWLQIAANGTLSGTPTLLDGGMNSWQIWVTDGTRFDTATLNIFVVAGPLFTGNLTFDNGEQDIPYSSPGSGSLNNYVVYDGSGTLTFAKVSGPAWLTVASNGDLSGTPDKTNVLNNAWVVSVTDGPFTNTTTLNIFVYGSPKFMRDPVVRANAYVSQGDYVIRGQTLAGSATDPFLPFSPTTLTWAKVSGPAWLTISGDGTLSGTPTAGNIGLNSWTISAANGYPATTASLRIIVAASPSPGSGPVEVVNREYWDGIANPHAADGVSLTGTGTASDPATYTVPRGLYLYGQGQIYTSLATGEDSEASANPMHIKFNIQGDLNIDAPNNAFVTAIHARSYATGMRNLILDLNGTNSILGQGRIIGLGHRVDDVANFPDCFDKDTPRILTISNVNNVSLYDLNLRVYNVNNWPRPLLIRASGKVEVTAGIDNTDKQTSGLGGCDVTVYAKSITTGDVLSFTRRTKSGAAGVGNIVLKALAPPSFNPGDGLNNTGSNSVTLSGLMVATNGFGGESAQGAISTESVVLRLGPAVVLNTIPAKRTLNVGKIQNGAGAGDLFINQSFGVYVANYVVDWSSSNTPASPMLLLAPAPPGQIVLGWSGDGFVLQQNSDLSTPGGWVNAPSGTNNPGTNTIGAGPLFYRLKSLP